MGTSTSFRSGDKASPPDPRSIPCLCLPTASGTPGTGVTLEPGDDVVAALGPGKAAAWVLAIHAGAGSPVEVSPATATWTSLSGNLTKSGSGPDIAIGNASGFSGAVDDFFLKVKVKTAGALGVAGGELYWDGTNVAETIVFPQEGPAVVRGTVNIAGSVPAMNGLTLIFTDPGSTTITFGSSPSTPDALVAAFDALAVSGSLAVRSRIYEAATGEKYFELYSTATGTTAAITISSSSTGEATLGLATTTANGTAATLTLPNSGAKLTFTAGTYVLDESYTKTLTGPTASLAAQIAAATAARANFAEHPFGYLVFDAQASNVAAATLATSIGSSVSTWRSDPDAPVFVDFVIGTALHTASATPATNAANIGTNDASFTSAIGSLSADIARNFALDDCYIGAPAGLPLGRSRRSAALAAAIRRASLDRIAGNPGQFTIPGVTLVAADGLTLARDEATAVTKLGKLTGKAWCLKSVANQLGVARFEVSPTGAGSLSRYRDPGTVAIAFTMAAAAFPIVAGWQGESWETDPESPKAAADFETQSRADLLADTLRPIARPANKPANISGELRVTLTAPQLLDDGKVYPSVVFNPVGVVQDVVLVFTATGVEIEGAEEES